MLRVHAKVVWVAGEPAQLALELANNLAVEITVEIIELVTEPRGRLQLDLEPPSQLGSISHMVLPPRSTVCRVLTCTPALPPRGGVASGGGSLGGGGGALVLRGVAMRCGGFGCVHPVTSDGRGVEVGVEIGPEINPEISPEISPEIVPETVPEIVPETVPEIVAELARAVGLEGPEAPRCAPLPPRKMWPPSEALPPPLPVPLVAPLPLLLPEHGACHAAAAPCTAASAYRGWPHHSHPCRKPHIHHVCLKLQPRFCPGCNPASAQAAAPRVPRRA